MFLTPAGETVLTSAPAFPAAATTTKLLSFNSCTFAFTKALLGMVHGKQTTFAFVLSLALW